MCLRVPVDEIYLLEILLEVSTCLHSIITSIFRQRWQDMLANKLHNHHKINHVRDHHSRLTHTVPISPQRERHGTWYI